MDMLDRTNSALTRHNLSRQAGVIATLGRLTLLSDDAERDGFRRPQGTSVRGES
jgi:hypothetical protein